MAISISINITQNSQDAAANKSNVSVAVVAKWTNGSYNRNQKPGYLIIDEIQYDFTSYFNYDKATSGSATLFSKTLNIVHDDNGKKRLVCEASYTSGVSSGTVTASAEKDLTPIPRASTIGASDANIGSKSTIVVTRKSTAYMHSIAYQFGNLTGYVTAAGGVSSTEVKYTNTSISWTIPSAFYAQIPNAKSGTCTLTIKTYSGSTQIGSAQTDTFTVTAPQSLCAPAVSGSVVDSNTATKALTGDENKLVRYYSTALCTITATAKNSATISAKKIGGTAVSGPTRSIAKVEVDSISFYAKDSRGYEDSVTVDVDLIPYVILTNNAAIKRTDADGNAVLTLKGNYYNGSFGAEDNALTAKYRVGDGDYVELSPEISGNTYKLSATISGLDYRQAYQIQVVVSDKLDQAVKTIPLGKSIPIFDWGENDFNFNVSVTAPSFNGVSQFFKYKGPCADADECFDPGVYRLVTESQNVPNTNGLMLVFGDGSSSGGIALQIAMKFDTGEMKRRMLWYGNKFAWRDW